MIPQEEKALRTKKRRFRKTKPPIVLYTTLLQFSSEKMSIPKLYFVHLQQFHVAKKILPRSTQELERSVAYSLIVKSFHKVSLLQR